MSSPRRHHNALRGALSAIKVERGLQVVVGSGHLRPPHVARLELRSEFPLELPCLEPPARVGLVVVRTAFSRELAHRLEACRPRAETKSREVALKPAASDEANLRVEMFADRQPLDLQPVAVGVVVELRPVADLV